MTYSYVSVSDIYLHVFPLDHALLHDGLHSFPLFPGGPPHLVAGVLTSVVLPLVGPVAAVADPVVDSGGDQDQRGVADVGAVEFPIGTGGGAGLIGAVLRMHDKNLDQSRGQTPS